MFKNSIPEKRREIFKYLYGKLTRANLTGITSC